MKRVDVAILGAGPAGAATALALRTSGLTTLLVDRRRDHAPIGETLPPETKKLLVELGVWEQFISQGHLPSRGTRAAWGKATVHGNDFLYGAYGVGWHVDRARFDAQLRMAVRECGTAILRGAARVGRPHGETHCWLLDVDGQDIRERVQARVLVDATGRASALGRIIAGRKIAVDRLIGVVAFADLTERPRPRPRDERGVTLIEASEGGWWYAAEVPGSRLAVSYVTDADLFARANRSEFDHFEHLLGKTSHIRRWTRGCPLVAPPRVVAAHTARLRAVTGTDWLAVGDAAMTFDPLSSQGIYAALESALRAANAIERQFGGDPCAFAGYASWIDKRFAAHLVGQRYYYRKEQRWAAKEFWKRRHLVSTAPST